MFRLPSMAARARTRALSVMQRRDYHVAWHPTKFAGDRLMDPGHVQIHTTDAEREQFPALKPVYGHSPMQGNAPKRETFVTEMSIPSTPLGGEPKIVKKQGSFVKDARKFGEDHHRGEKMFSQDMGPLDARKAAALAGYHHADLFEVTGKRKINCVHGAYGAMAEMHGLSPTLPSELDNMMPQQLASYVTDLRKKKGETGS